MWPDDDHPRFLFVCDEETSVPAVQRIDLSRPAAGNVTTIVNGLSFPDGDDDDVQTDGCVRFASTRDTSAEPSGFIFLGSGESAFLSIQHRAANDRLGGANHGALIKISGFDVKSRDREHDWDWNR